MYVYIDCRTECLNENPLSFSGVNTDSLTKYHQGEYFIILRILGGSVKEKEM